jgi:subtilisin-like proprotein convertase family protein
MRRTIMPTRIALVILVALLALPIAPAASPVAAKKRSRTVTRVFTNPATIDLPVTNVYSGPAELYPSPIAVHGLRGKIRDVNIRLDDLTHNHPANVFVLLVGPSGQSATVMARVGHTAEIAGVTLRLDDEAAASIPDNVTLQSGTYRPTNVTNGSYPFPDPAPSASASPALSVFDGANPNGTWRLFVMDGYPTDTGAFAGGWELEITARIKAKRKRR